MALTAEEIKELEALKKDPMVKLGRRIINDPEKQKLYALRYLRKKGLEAVEAEEEVVNEKKKVK